MPKSLRSLTLLALLLVLLLAACSPDPAPQQAATATLTRTGTPPVTATATAPLTPSPSQAVASPVSATRTAFAATQTALAGSPATAPGSPTLPPAASTAPSVFPTVVLSGTVMFDTATPFPSRTPTITPTPTSTFTPSPTPGPSATPTPEFLTLPETPLPLPLSAISIGTAARVSGLAGWQNGSVTDFAWTPDAALLAVANYSGIDIYEVQTRRLLRSLYPRGEGVASIDFSPDGRWLAAGSMRGTEKTGYGSSIELWAGPDWRPLGVLFGQPRGLSKVAFSPTNRHFVAALTSLEPVQNSSVEFWNTTTWEITGTINTGTVLNFAFSPDGKLFALTPDRYAITVWDLIEKEKRFTLPTSFTGAVNSLAFSPDGTRLASGHYDGEIRIWDTATGSTLLSFNDGGGVVESLAFSPDGTLLATGSSYADNLVRLWAVQSGDLLNRLDGHAHAVNHLVFSPDGELLVSGSYDGSVRLWGVRP